MKMKKWAALAALLLAVGAATGATAEVAVNDHVFFGHYEQDNDLTNGAEAIEWRVLKVENGEALLISQYALDSQPYYEKYAVALWSVCTLRTWLNTAFFDAAFNDTVYKRFLVLHTFASVQSRVKTVLQGSCKAVRAGLLRELQICLDPLRFDYGKPFPRLQIVIDGFLHPFPPFHGLEPYAVKRQPVFGVNLNQFNQLLF